MPKLDVENVKRSIYLDTRMMVACGMPKLHKGKGNLPPHRLVVTAIDSSFHCIIRWVDMCLMQTLYQTPGCVKNNLT